MRVIAGRYGGRLLTSPAGQSTRPTTEKVRQAVFNSLTAAGLLEGAAVVDLFAGSGALGIEAISRGAASAVFVERDRAALAALDRNLATLGIAEQCRVVRGDVVAWVPGMRGVDIALVDPPYAFDGWGRLLGSMQAALVVAESGEELAGQPGWSVRRVKRYGRTWVTMLERD